MLIFVSVFVHAGAMSLAIDMLHHFHERPLFRVNRWTRPLPVAGLVIMMFLASIVEAILWAVTYVEIGAIESFEESIYFSMVTYTTLGYGDVTLQAPYRILSSFEAAAGVIMFGWTTALIFAAVQRVYFSSAHEAAQPTE